MSVEVRTGTRDFDAGFRSLYLTLATGWQSVSIAASSQTVLGDNSSFDFFQVADGSSAA
jgi:hypothetical protein